MVIESFNSLSEIFSYQLPEYIQKKRNLFFRYFLYFVITVELIVIFLPDTLVITETKNIFRRLQVLALIILILDFFLLYLTYTENYKIAPVLHIFAINIGLFIFSLYIVSADNFSLMSTWYITSILMGSLFLNFKENLINGVFILLQLLMTPVINKFLSFDFVIAKIIVFVVAVFLVLSVSIFQIILDIERNSAYLKAEEQVNKFQELFHSSPIAIWLLDMSRVTKWINQLEIDDSQEFSEYIYREDNSEEINKLRYKIQILDVNNTTLEMYNAKNRKELSNHYLHKFDEEWLSEIRFNLIEFYNKNSKFSYETTDYKLSGEKFYLRVNWIAHSDNYSNVIVTRENITNEVENKKQLQEMQEKQFQAQKFNAIGRLAGGVAHDINNLLTALNGYISIIRKSDRIENILPHIDEIERLSKRGSVLTEQILAYSRKQPHKPQVLDPNQEILELKPLIRSITGEKHEITYALDPLTENIKIDRNQFTQIFLNLTINSKEAMRDHGNITINLSNSKITPEKTNLQDIKPGNYVKIVYSDTGSGIAKENLSKIFDPFFTTKNTTKSAGLGLSMIHGIIRQNQGYISVQSERNLGTSFTILLPAIKEDAENTKKTQSIVKEIGNNGKTMLIVEDEDQIREMLQISFEEEMNVIVASNGEEALEIAQEQDNIDVVLTDIVMPKMNGNVMIPHIKELFPNIKVIYMSGYSKDTINLDFDELKADLFLKKPFNFKEMKIKIRDLLS